jgi:hypothetical protein
MLRAGGRRLAFPQGIRTALERLLEEDLIPRRYPDLRARRLLNRLLSPPQRKEFARHGYFTVQVPGRGAFRILPGTAFNVMDLKTGVYYCAGPERPMPLADWLLAQKLVLENDPERFFRVAHRMREDY